MSYREDLLRYYSGLVQKHGAGFGALNWGSERGQAMRFRVLMEIADLRHASVLDVGCGHGDLCAALAPLGVNYHGIDMHADMISAAAAKYPGRAFEVKDLAAQPCDMAYDYVFASGIFAVAVTDNERYWKTTAVAMWRAARKGVAFNMLSDRLPESEREAGEMYYDPAAVFSWCGTLTPYVTLRHDYKLNDFSVYLYRDAQGELPPAPPRR